MPFDATTVRLVIPRLVRGRREKKRFIALCEGSTKPVTLSQPFAKTAHTTAPWRLLLLLFAAVCWHLAATAAAATARTTTATATAATGAWLPLLLLLLLVLMPLLMILLLPLLLRLLLPMLQPQLPRPQLLHILLLLWLLVRLLLIPHPTATTSPRLLLLIILMTSPTQHYSPPLGLSGTYPVPTAHSLSGKPPKVKPHHALTEEHMNQHAFNIKQQALRHHRTTNAPKSPRPQVMRDLSHARDLLHFGRDERMDSIPTFSRLCLPLH